MLALGERTPLFVPRVHQFTSDGITYLIDPERPNWIALEEGGANVFESMSGSAPTFGALVARYAAERQLEAGKAWVHMHDFVRGLDRAGFVSSEAIQPPAYQGRAAMIKPGGLRELWIQINNNCNLTCTHCLVSSGPKGIGGLPPQKLVQIVDDAAKLGVERLYITGGEPMLRKDLFDLIRHASEDHGLEVIVLSNATIVAGAIKQAASTLNRDLVKFQVSIDGARPETNDPIRGAGTFRKALEGTATLADLGFSVSLTTVTTEENLEELHRLPAIAKSAGAKSQHLMWSHKRGRAVESDNGFFPESAALIGAVLQTIDTATSEGIALDNYEAVKRRTNGVPGVKFDLGNAGWDSICVFADGKVYPSAALADEKARGGRAARRNR